MATQSGRQHTVVAMPMLARWRNQGGETIQKLQGRQGQRCFPVRVGLGQVVDQALIRFEPGQPFAGEDRASTIAQQAFETGSIPGGDPHLGVERKPPGGFER